MGSLGVVALPNSKESPGRSLEHRILERDIARAIARNGCIPTVAKSHLGKFDMLGFPQKEAVKPKSDIVRILARGPSALHFSRNFVGQFLRFRTAWCCHAIRRRIAQIDAANLADGFAQRLSDDDCPSAREHTGAIHLAANDEPVVGRAIPPESR